MRKRSSLNFASKLNYSPVLPEHLIRSSKTQQAINNSNKFYRENIEKREELLEQQLSYKEKESSRSAIEPPSNVITLKNGTRWYFDSQKRVFINADTGEEITMSQWSVYTAMIHLQYVNQEYDSGSSGMSGIKTILFSADRPDADGVTPLIATPVMYGSSENVTFTFTWSYTNEIDVTS